MKIKSKGERIQGFSIFHVDTAWHYDFSWMELQRHIFIMNNKQLELEYKHSGMKRSEHHSGFEILCIDQNILNYIDRNENITAIKVILQYPILKKI